MCFSFQSEQDIFKIAKVFSAKVSKQHEAQFEKLLEFQSTHSKSELEKLLGLPASSRRKMPIIKRPGDDERVYSNYFTNVLATQNGESVLQPMRYRIRPKHSPGEIPTKYNVYNARVESLENMSTWKNLFMHNHGLVPIISFFEWVKSEGQRQMISFTPTSHDLMWAPCLWDEWIDSTGEYRFFSFAIITNDPPPQISRVGHDRCPIFLKEEYFGIWLEPQKYSKSQISRILKDPQGISYSFQKAS